MDGDPRAGVEPKVEPVGGRRRTKGEHAMKATIRFGAVAAILAGTLTMVFAQATPRPSPSPTPAGTAAPAPTPAGAATPAAAPPASGVEVKVDGIQENRVKEFGEMMGASSTMQVSLSVTGEAAGKASRYGKLQIDKAVDDKGTVLVDKDDFFGRKVREGFVSVEDQFGPKVKNGFGLSLHLKAARRDAAKIAQIKGTFVILSGGKKTDVVIPEVAGKAGKELDDAALKAAGVVIKIGAATPKEVAYTVAGTTDVVLDISLADALGNKVDTNRMSESMGGGPTTYHLSAATGDLPAKTGLKVTLLTDAKPLTVPFDLKDIPLP
jgi:hypothetical protein